MMGEEPNVLDTGAIDRGGLRNDGVDNEEGELLLDIPFVQATERHAVPP